MRERWRAEHMTDDREPPLVLPRSKMCVRCHYRKPVREFANYRVRLCLACDGPTAPWTVPT
jgi:imidazolonepropionase-like amidohydrolase